MHAVFFFVFFCGNGPSSLLYTYTHSHLGPARHDRSSTISLRGVPQKLVGLIVLLKDTSMGIVKGG